MAKRSLEGLVLSTTRHSFKRRIGYSNPADLVDEDEQISSNLVNRMDV